MVMQHTTGQLFVMSGPSGTGKTTLAKELIKQHPRLVLSISTTTRHKRPKEKEGIDYDFVSEQQFEQMATTGQFLEYAHVFNHYYGTPKTKVMEQLRQGKDVMLEIDWQGAAKVRAQLDCISIFVLPPDRNTLSQRLLKRQQDSPEVIQQRLAQATQEITHYQDFDYLVVNQNFEEAVTSIHTIMIAQHLTRRCQQQTLALLLKQLLHK